MRRRRVARSVEKSHKRLRSALIECSQQVSQQNVYTTPDGNRATSRTRSPFFGASRQTNAIELKSTPHHWIPSPLQTFNELDLLPAIQKALKSAKYTTPTEIQARAIPEALAGRDILGCAQTGTGKTAAFVLPILHHLGSNRRRPAPGHPHALILSPTRELAIQISDNISKYARFLKMRATLVYGGVSQIHQVRSLRRGTRILVATPGRLLDLMEQGHLTLSHLEHFVLDEADRMLDMGFLPDLEKIISELPEQRQSQFFSATLAPKITELAQGLLHDPVSINIAPEKRSLDQIEQFLTEVKTSEKISRLTEILTSTDVRRAIVFIRTKRNTSKVEMKLADAGLQVGSIHGDKSQNARQRTLMAFRRGKINILTATDVAARGIDVDDVSHVINFDLPEDAETYVHRIGRTGRAGAKGTAITFYTAAQRREVREIERYLGNETDADPIEAMQRQKRGNRKKNHHGGTRGDSNRSGSPRARSRDSQSRRGPARRDQSVSTERFGKPKASKTTKKRVDATDTKRPRRRQIEDSNTQSSDSRQIKKSTERIQVRPKHSTGKKSQKSTSSRSNDARATYSDRSATVRDQKQQRVSGSKRSRDEQLGGKRPSGKRPIRATESGDSQDERKKNRGKSKRASDLEKVGGADSGRRKSKSGNSAYASNAGKPEHGERRKKRNAASKPTKRPQKRRTKKATYHFTEEFINQVKKAQKFRNQKKATKRAKPKRG